MASLYQCGASYGLRAFAFSRAQSNDRRVLAKRFRGIALRHSSVARRIRRMGVGAEGCAQRRLFYADAGCICSLCAGPPHSLSACGVAFRFWADVEAMLVTLPFVLLLLDYWPLGRLGGQKSEVGSRLRRLITEKIPLFALSAFSCIATLLTQRQGPNDRSIAISMETKQYVCELRYLHWQMLWPARLAVFYPHPNDRLPLLELQWRSHSLLVSAC